MYARVCHCGAVYVARTGLHGSSCSMDTELGATGPVETVAAITTAPQAAAAAAATVSACTTVLNVRLPAVVDVFEP